MGSGVEPVLERIVRAETVSGLLSPLTGRQRLVATRFYLEQKTERQIAGELGITAPAVSKILAKAVSRMWRECQRVETAPYGMRGGVCHAREKAV